MYMYIITKWHSGPKNLLDRVRIDFLRKKFRNEHVYFSRRQKSQNVWKKQLLKNQTNRQKSKD